MKLTQRRNIHWQSANTWNFRERPVPDEWSKGRDELCARKDERSEPVAQDVETNSECCYHIADAILSAKCHR